MAHLHLDAPVLASARHKAFLGLLPLLFVCYVIAFVDRVNVGFAKLEMQGDLRSAGFTEKVFGFGMGAFFLGYLLPEIPATLIMEHWSARKWIARIMVSWGIVAALTAFVKTPFQFYLARFALGIAEAGFYPGVIVFLTHWFPKTDRTKALAWFFIGTPIAQMIGPPISAQMMAFAHSHSRLVWDLTGWQLVFILWGIPAVVLGVVTWFVLADSPRQARWLTNAEKDALEELLHAEKTDQRSRSMPLSIFQTLQNPRVITLALAYFLVVTCSYGIELYLPSIVEDWYQPSIVVTSLLLVIPATGGFLGQLLVGWNSDRLVERRWHTAGPILLGAITLLFVPATQGNLWLTICAFTLTMVGVKAYLPAFWSLPNIFLTESAAAAGIGFINSFGNLGGWAGPTIIGYMKDQTKSYGQSLFILSAFAITSAIVIVLLPLEYRHPQTQEPVDPSTA